MRSSRRGSLHGTIPVIFDSLDLDLSSSHFDDSANALLLARQLALLYAIDIIVLVLVLDSCCHETVVFRDSQGSKEGSRPSDRAKVEIAVGLKLGRRGNPDERLDQSL